VTVIPLPPCRRVWPTTGILALAVCRVGFAQGPIVVGPNVMVSSASPGREHAEYLADAHPSDPNRVMVCSMRFSPAGNQKTSGIYVTFDGGKTWSLSLEDSGSGADGAADPVCAYGLNGHALFATIVSAPETLKTDHTRYDVYQWWRMGGDNNVHLYRSTDDGRTWGDTVFLPFLDRPNLTVDHTRSRYRGRSYIYGNTSGRGLWLIYSTDGGRTWVRSERTDTTIHLPGDGTVLPTGTLVFPFQLLPAERAIATASSTDGGVHINMPVHVAHLWGVPSGPVECAPVGSMNMASDHSAGPFRGRAYITWADLYRGRCTAHVSYSYDEGKTWSPPAPVRGDERPRPKEIRGKDRLMPQIAVNPSGVVGVTWYDWADDGRTATLRFAASLDGGESWLPSVVVSTHGFVIKHPPELAAQTTAEGGGERRREQRTEAIEVIAQPAPRTYYPWNLFPGDYTGLAAGADGAFHAFWIDNRSGVGELYTARVAVEGMVAKPGADMAPLTNVTSAVEVQFTSSVWDARTRKIAWEYRLMNTSPDTIRGPLKLRIVQLSSDFGVPTLLLERGRTGGPGTIIDLSAALVSGRLLPGQTTPPQRLRARLDDLRETLALGASDLVHMQVRVYGSRARSAQAERASSCRDHPTCDGAEPGTAGIQGQPVTAGHRADGNR